MPKIDEAIFTQSKDGCTLSIYQDDYADTPRKHSEPLGKMISFHKRYDLGDKHDYQTPNEFLEDVANELYPDFDKHFEKLEYGALRNLISKTAVILPLYFYDHSVQSISTESFIGRAVHAEWDSGLVGEVFCSHEDVKKAFGHVTPQTIEWTKHALKMEVAEYDSWLRGECYGYMLTDENGDEIDSCWGFYGDLDKVKEQMKDYLGSEFAGLLNAETVDESWDEEL